MPRGYTPPGSGMHNEPETQTVVVYTNPMTSSGYDPDGIQSLLNEDEIDWDAFDWESWSWVVHPDLENTPSWEDLDRDERQQWVEDNEDRFEDVDWHPVYGPDLGDDSTIGTIYDADVASGAEGGTEINYDYYAQDPWYNLAFSNLGIEIDDEEGLTEENLQEATKYLVETFRSVMNDGYREPWDAELPEKWEPKEMTTDYVTPFEIPGIVPRSMSPIMGPNLRKFSEDAGVWRVDAFNKLKARDQRPQPGFKGTGKPEQFETEEEREAFRAAVDAALDDSGRPVPEGWTPPPVPANQPPIPDSLSRDVIKKASSVMAATSIF